MNYLITGSEMLAAQKGFKLVGRDADLERLTSILLRGKSRSVILAGPGGVGCTALCLGLQASKDAPDAPFDVISKRLLWLQTDALFSSGNSEQITDNYNKIIAQLNRTPDSVLIIEDARDFIDAARSNGLGNFINSLNNAVKTDKTQVILETRDDDLDIVLKAHSDMRECYTLIDLAEPINGALRAIVTANAAHLVAYHGIRIADDAIEAAIELTSKYRTRDLGLSRAQPERSTTLLDRTLATYRLNAHKRHPDMDRLVGELGDHADSAEGRARIQALEAEFEQHQKDIKRLYKAQRDGEAAIAEIQEHIDAIQKEEEQHRQDGQEPEAPVGAGRIATLTERLNTGGFDSARVTAERAKLKKFEEAVAANRAQFQSITAQMNERLVITRDTVVEQFSLISGISVSKLNQDERKKLRGMEEAMQDKVFGQDVAIRKLANAIKVSKVGKRSGGEPLASFLFMGPSGVGKTELAKVLTQILLDDAGALTRFDMSEYMEKHAVAKLIGAPPGYEGFEAGGILTNEMRRNPRRVLLFDEIEKAHPDVFNIFLQILSDSRLTDNVGRVVSFDDAVIIMTTNIGQKAFLDPHLSDEEAEAAAMVELEATYRAELLNRFAGRENIVCFKRLGLNSMARIVRREVTKIAEKYAGNGVGLVMAQGDVEAFCSDQYKPERGARGLPGYIKAHLEPVLANIALEQPDFQGEVAVSYDQSRHAFATHIMEKAHGRA